MPHFTRRRGKEPPHRGGESNVLFPRAVRKGDHLFSVLGVCASEVRLNGKMPHTIFCMQEPGRVGACGRAHNARAQEMCLVVGRVVPLDKPRFTKLHTINGRAGPFERWEYGHAHTIYLCLKREGFNVSQWCCFHHVPEV